MATRNCSQAPLNGQELFKSALRLCQQGTSTRSHIRLSPFGSLLFYVQDQQLESMWLPQALTNKTVLSHVKAWFY